MRPRLIEWPDGQEVSERVLAKMAYRAEPEGVVALVEAPRFDAPARRHASTSSPSGSRSPATSARSRAAPRPPAPTRSLVAEAHADPFNPNAIRASTGAVFTLPVVEATLDEVRRARLALVAAVVGRRDRAHRGRPQPPARDRGRRRGRAACPTRGAQAADAGVSIPLRPGAAPRASTSAAAAAILLFEAVRQRG